jgi:hypothetical protein
VQAVFGFYDAVAEVMEHRFLLFTDELVPLLMEAAASRNKEVKKTVESVIAKIQNLSGVKIERLGK